MDNPPVPNHGLEQIRFDISYLRDRIDKIYDEVHAVKKTDWVAVAAISGFILTIGSIIGALAMAPIKDALFNHENRLVILETRNTEMPEKMRGIAKDTVNDFVRHTNEQWFPTVPKK